MRIVTALCLIVTAVTVNAGSHCNEFYPDKVCSLDEPEDHRPSRPIDIRAIVNGDQQVLQTKCKQEPKCLCSTDQTNTIKVICTNANLTTVPIDLPLNTSILDLSSNFIKEIPTKAFVRYSKLQRLYLSNNKIEILYPKAFTGLYRLQFMSISGNKLRYRTTSIPYAVFNPLHNLTSLQMHQNLSDIADDEDYPVQALSEIPGLSCLYIDWMPHKSVAQLSTLSSLRLLAFRGKTGRCDIKHITKQMFQNLTKLKALSIRDCDLEKTDNGCFSNMKSLQVLDLSNNEKLGLKRMANFTYGLKNTELLLLNITYITFSGSDCQQLTSDHFKYIFETNLQTLILDENRISYMSSDAVRYIPTKMICVSMRKNIMLAGPYVYLVFLQKRLNSVQVFDMSQQCKNPRLFKFNDIVKRTDNTVNSESIERKLNTNNISIVAKNIYNNSNAEEVKEERDINVNSCLNCVPYRDNNSFIIFRFPKSITSFYMSDTALEIPLDNGFCVCEPNTLQTLDLSKNNLYKWQGPFIGLNNLTKLNMSSNNCEEIYPSALQFMRNLKELYLSRNVLFVAIAKDTLGLIFSQQHNLQILDLSDNKIQTVPHNFLSGLKNTRILKLNQNFLTNTNFDISYMVHLIMLDLSNNLLESISEPTRTHLNIMSSVRITYLDITNNNFQCTCKTINFIKWIANSAVYFVNRQTYTCKFSNGTVGKLSTPEHAHHIYRALDKECANYMIIILLTSFGILFALVIVFGGLLYRYRWDIRYMYYSAKFRFFKKRGYIPVRNMDDEEFEHDVFVSYADNDRRYVKQMVVPELEEKRHLKLLVHDRDFIAGNFVSENIMRAISVSRKTLIIMTPSFLASYWCCFEMNMARKESIHTGRNVVCVLMKEHVPQGKLPLEIQDIIRNQTYADIPENDEHQQQFWDSLKDSLLSE